MNDEAAWIFSFATSIVFITMIIIIARLVL